MSDAQSAASIVRTVSPGKALSRVRAERAGPDLLVYGWTFSSAGEFDPSRIQNPQTKLPL